MDKKGIYLRSGSDSVFSGVEKKIQNQIKFFSTKFTVKEIIIKKAQTNFVRSVLYRLPGGSFGRMYDEAFEEIREQGDIEFFYIRSNAFDRKYRAFLEKIRNNYPNSKIILEIPTYPYAHELLHSSTMWPWFFKDKVNSKHIDSIVDRIVTFSNDDYIMGVQTIRSMNGMDVDSFEVADTVPLDGINMIAVAMMQPYHGFERLINGMATYYSGNTNKEVSLKLVGYGPELENYKELVESKGLSGRIEFKGKLTGEELDKAYDGCDIAIGSMGGYKIGINMFSSIKLGEYLAKGLPVVTGGRTLIFEKSGKEYNLDFPNDDSDIDINKIVDFYEAVYSGKKKEDVRREIHEFAKENIDVKVAMKDIMEYLETEK